MSASIQWSGLLELREALKHLPDDLTAEATAIARDAATGARDEIRGVYPVATGNLVRGVTLRESKKGRWQAAFRVISRAPHASIFEKGTKVRTVRYRNGKLLKTPANRGVMPAADLFVPIVMRHRARMWAPLKALVERAGFEVYGG